MRRLFVILLMFVGVSLAQSPKQCAYNLTRQTIDATNYRGNDVGASLFVNALPYIVPPSPKDLAFPAPRKPYTVTPPTREVCPYERAVEVFGADRVEFSACANAVNSLCPQGKTCRCIPGVIVDGKPIYEESDKKVGTP